MQPFTIVFPLFISVFVVRVLPRIILAPVALLTIMVMNRWFEPFVDELQLPAELPRVHRKAYEPSHTELFL